MAAGVTARPYDLEPPLAELEDVTVTQDAIDGEVAAAHLDDRLALLLEREDTGEAIPEVVPLASDRLDPDHVLERRGDLERGVPAQTGWPPMWSGCPCVRTIQAISSGSTPI